MSRAAGEVIYRSRIEALLKRAILLDPGWPDAHYQLGVLYGRQGNYKAAAEELEKAAQPIARLKGGALPPGYCLSANRAHGSFGERDATISRSAGPLSGTEGRMGVDLDQFISVLGKPENVARGSVCPGDTP